MQKVINLESPRTGKAVANQFVIREEGRGALGNFIWREVFQSYDSVIATMTKWEDGTSDIVLDPVYWDYSNTTRKYLYQFMRSHGIVIDSRKDVLKAIDAKRFKLEDLNR
jgi:hypothetical protein